MEQRGLQVGISRAIVTEGENQLYRLWGNALPTVLFPSAVVISSSDRIGGSWKYRWSQRLVKLRYFVGMTVEEEAQALDISQATAKRYWAYARAWLAEEKTVDSSDPSTLATGILLLL